MTIELDLQREGEGDGFEDWRNDTWRAADIASARRDIRAFATTLADRDVRRMALKIEKLWRQLPQAKASKTSEADMLAAYRDGYIEGVVLVLRHALQDAPTYNGR